MKKAYRRSEKRYCAKDHIDINATFLYMGKPYIGKVNNLSSGGSCLTIEKESFSIIDYEIIDLNISTDSDNFTIPARVLYSNKVGASGMKRKYGLSFLSHDQLKLNSFIEENCKSLKRAFR